MERNSLGHIDALIHLSCFAAEITRCSFEAMKNDAETRLEAASRNAKIAIVRNVVFANATASGKGLLYLGYTWVDLVLSRLSKLSRASQDASKAVKAI